jgi:Fe-S cluster assembly scaffold protein SufB
MIRLIAKNSETPVKLSALLKEHVSGAFSTDKLELEVVIPVDVVVMLVDDLHDLEITNSNVTCVISERANCSYTFSFVDRKRTETAVFDKKVSLVCIGRGAIGSVDCRAFGAQSDKFKMITVQDHQASNTTTNVVVKGVFDGLARFWCDSIIKVPLHVEGIVADQVNKNILLSRTSRAVSIPQLEVESHDVQCAHGAAVSQLSDEHLFYLQSRGMTESEAKEMLIEAFLN